MGEVLAPNRSRNLRRGQLVAHSRRDVRGAACRRAGSPSAGSPENRVWSHTEVWIAAAWVCAQATTKIRCGLPVCQTTNPRLKITNKSTGMIVTFEIFFFFYFFLAFLMQNPNMLERFLELLRKNPETPKHRHKTFTKRQLSRFFGFC